MSNRIQNMPSGDSEGVTPSFDDFMFQQIDLFRRRMIDEGNMNELECTMQAQSFEDLLQDGSDARRASLEKHPGVVMREGQSYTVNKQKARELMRIGQAKLMFMRTEDVDAGELVADLSAHLSLMALMGRLSDFQQLLIWRQICIGINDQLATEVCPLGEEVNISVCCAYNFEQVDETAGGMFEGVASGTVVPMMSGVLSSLIETGVLTLFSRMVDGEFFENN